MTLAQMKQSKAVSHRIRSILHNYSERSLPVDDLSSREVEIGAVDEHLFMKNPPWWSKLSQDYKERSATSLQLPAL